MTMLIHDIRRISAEARRKARVQITLAIDELGHLTLPPQSPEDQARHDEIARLSSHLDHL